MILGASFSHLHLKCLGLDPLNAIKEYKILNLNWIRLGCYWNEIEKEEGKYNFSTLDKLVDFCEKNKLNVALTIGMKAPRWPEYYIPGWLEEKLNLLNKNHLFTQKDKEVFGHLQKFIKACVNHYKNINQIKVWQVENEPFETFGPYSRKIKPEFLNKEIGLFNQYDGKRKKCLNFGTGSIIKNGLFFCKTTPTDIVGLDVYFKSELNFANRKIIINYPKFILKFSTKLLKSLTKSDQLWITELQAEPWETDGYNIENPKSFLLDDFEKNLKFALKLNPKLILFWGFEYWLWKKTKGDLRYWTQAKRIINKYSKL